MPFICAKAWKLLKHFTFLIDLYRLCVIINSVIVQEGMVNETIQLTERTRESERVAEEDQKPNQSLHDV